MNIKNPDKSTGKTEANYPAQRCTVAARSSLEVALRFPPDRVERARDTARPCHEFPPFSGNGRGCRAEETNHPTDRCLSGRWRCGARRERRPNPSQKKRPGKAEARRSVRTGEPKSKASYPPESISPRTEPRPIDGATEAAGAARSRERGRPGPDDGAAAAEAGAVDGGGGRGAGAVRGAGGGGAVAHAAAAGGPAALRQELPPAVDELPQAGHQARPHRRGRGGPHPPPPPRPRQPVVADRREAAGAHGQRDQELLEFAPQQEAHRPGPRPADAHAARRCSRQDGSCYRQDDSGAGGRTAATSAPASASASAADLSCRWNWMRRP